MIPLLLNLNINIMYSSEDLEIKCKSNTMKLASFVEMQPLLYKDLFPVSNRGIASWRIDTEFLCKEQSSLQLFFEMVQGHTQTDCRGKGRFLNKIVPISV